jgi:hypothetical protein
MRANTTAVARVLQLCGSNSENPSTPSSRGRSGVVEIANCPADWPLQLKGPDVRFILPEAKFK